MHAYSVTGVTRQQRFGMGKLMFLTAARTW